MSLPRSSNHMPELVSVTEGCIFLWFNLPYASGLLQTLISFSGPFSALREVSRCRALSLLVREALLLPSKVRNPFFFCQLTFTYVIDQLQQLFTISFSLSHFFSVFFFHTFSYHLIIGENMLPNTAVLAITLVYPFDLLASMLVK